MESLQRDGEGLPPRRAPQRRQRGWAIATSPVPFDADLGSDAKGHPAVVYSRCASYRHERGARDRCDLYLIPLATGAERKLAAASTASASESNPTLWRGRLAWISERKSARPAVYQRSLTAPAARRSKRLPGLPARACNIHGSKPCARVSDGVGEEIELAGDKLAEVVAYSAGTGESTEIRLASVRSGKARRIAFQNIGENNQLYTGLSFSSRKLAWFRGCYENPGCAGSGPTATACRRIATTARCSRGSTAAGSGPAARRTPRS